MNRFAKRATCPSTPTLEAHRAAALAHDTARFVAAHLADCDFCSAELRLLDASSAAPSDADEQSAPPVPLALRLFAEQRLADIALRSSLTRLRAA
jgi:hypothetical protein